MRPALAWVISHGWARASAWRRGAGRIFYPKAQTWPDARVWSVGNIEAGGTGKTPIICALAREAHARHHPVVILTRGYQGRRERSGGVIQPGDQQACASEWGDEPALLHALCPFAWVAVGADRLQALTLIGQRLVDAVVLLDDGFQNHQWKKDREIVLLTSGGFGRRVFRDYPCTLQRASLLIWTKGTTPPLGWLESRIPKVRLHLRARLWQSGWRGGGPYWLISGVGHPEELMHELNQSGYPILRRTICPDHAVFTAEKVRHYEQEAQAQDLVILLTGKDWVKWRQVAPACSHPAVVESEIEFNDQDGEALRLWRNALWG